MPVPNLTFFCELSTGGLNSIIDDRLIANMKQMNAKISLGITDFSSKRAEIVQRLNREGIPLDAWLLLPREQGFWLNLRNSPQVFQRYFEFQDWTKKFDLKWVGVGLDIEPDVEEFVDLLQRNWRSLPHYLGRIFSRFEWKRGLRAYRRLVSLIHGDGYIVESYQFPLIEDERKARSSILQRILGLVNLQTDREVWMLYTSFVRPHGPGMLASYASEAQAIAVGSTGGGIDEEFADFLPLTWDEFSRDLRLAWYWSNDLYIHSLEGCVRQGFLEQLKDFGWDYPVILPEAGIVRVEGWRRSLQTVLWIFSHTLVILGVAFGGVLIWRLLNRLIRKSQASRT